MECEKKSTEKMRLIYTLSEPCIIEEKMKEWSSGRVETKGPVHSDLERVVKEGGWKRVSVFRSYGINLLANEVIWHFSNLTMK